MKVFTERGANEPSMDDVVKESTSFLVAEESKRLSLTSPGHYQITPLNRDDINFETDVPKQATLSYVQDVSPGSKKIKFLNNYESK